MDAATQQELGTVAQMLLKDGNQHAARLLSLASDMTTSDGHDPWEPVPVVLQVLPMFLDLFRPADLQAIQSQLDKRRVFGRTDRTHTLTVAPALADPFSPNRYTGGTEAMQLCDAIAEALYPVSAYKLPDICRALGLDDGDVSEAMASKRSYVRNRIDSWTTDQLCRLGSTVVEHHYHAHLWGLLQLAAIRHPGTASPFKNLIFAADGPKPELILTDAVSNTIEISKNAEFCLVYDRPLDTGGLTWAQLVTWWADNHAPPKTSEHDAARQLYRRLWRSLDRGREPDDEPGPEKQLFRAYSKLLGEHGPHLPALIPQVYLHYDPYTRAHRRRPGPLPRQRMDFLMLLRGRRRLVLECDGRQHYATTTGQASPDLYAQMVAADRELHLNGYETVRFGGAEFRSQQHAGSMLNSYFTRLLIGHGYLPDNR
ncbi:hypothetical protein [Actinoplanes sichuanensis]|uniref:AbiJ-NTD3 domain-containing protein n=1 Tax=Actinoplanes sichuanensis TaxID=512349 RepID=A0ABW4A1U5_9ACTN